MISARRAGFLGSSSGLQDDYFVTRKLYSNVDFYSGLIYEVMGLPVEMWLAQWREMLDDLEQKIARPRQIYAGPDERAFVALSARP